MALAPQEIRETPTYKRWNTANYTEDSTFRAKPQAAALPRKPIDVEVLLHWTYQKQKADLVMEHGAGLNRFERIAQFGGSDSSPMADSCALVADGCHERVGASYDLHPDAEAVHTRVQKLSGDMRAVVVPCAKTGLRPNWAEGLRPRLEPLRRGDGRPTVVMCSKSRRPSYCPVQVKDHPEYILARRNEYLRWWETLAWLAWSLTSEQALTGHAVRLP
ncbi:MAG: hypothetical protein RLN70_12630, partial [Rhodospirillaceae bacterium]